MGLLKLAVKSIFFNWRTQLAVFLGSALAAAILAGALMTGDAVRSSLKQLVYQRLGRCEFAFTSPGRFVRSELAGLLAAELQGTCLPAIRLNGAVSKDGGRQRVNQLQILGVDNRFGELAWQPTALFDLAEDEAVVNAALAVRLSIEPGDELLLKIEQPQLLPFELPLLREAQTPVNLRVTIKAIAGDHELGRFSLQAEQASPLTVFVGLSQLQQQTGLGQRANLLLFTGNEPRQAATLQTAVPQLAALDAALARNLSLADAGLQLQELSAAGYRKLSSEQIFLNPITQAAALQADPGALPIFSYFVNSISLKDRVVPYSFVTGLRAAPDGTELAAGEIIITQWLADDLKAAVGDSLRLSYFVQAQSDSLIEESRTFSVTRIIPVGSPAAHGLFAPSFPGLSDVDNCRNWEPGIPVDLKRLRPQDEAYWDTYHAAPKAFLSLADARELWQNRFGSLTAVLYPQASASGAQLAAAITTALQPGELGLFFRPVLASGLQASARSVDFGSLFLGLSFFIILSALLLTALLFRFKAEQAAGEAGLLLSLGFRRGQVTFYLLSQSILIAAGGSLAGLLPGLGYATLVLHGLRTIWNDAVGTTYLALRLQPVTIIISLLAGTLMGTLSMWLGAGSVFRQTVTRLLGAKGQPEPLPPGSRPHRSLLVTGCLFAAVIILIIVSQWSGAAHRAAFFFAGGTLCLAGLMGLFYLVLRKLSLAGSRRRLSLGLLGFRNLFRRRKRSLLSAGLLASAVFIVVAVGANKKVLPAGILQNSSGTGGFELIGETSLPLLFDPGTPGGRKAYRLDAGLMQDTQIMAIRVHNGDDASCLNLNSTSQPRLLGINPALLDNRGAFSFASRTGELDPVHPWLSLEESAGPDMIYGIADQTVITWGLGKTVGDTLDFLDDRGRVFKVKLIGGLEGSLFQGNVLIAASRFLEKFPSGSGYRMLLVDCPQELTAAVRQNLETGLRDTGIDLEAASLRLAEFNKVENTYLLIFLLLGSLGIFTGTGGLAIVTLRKIMESANELAVLRALGFRLSAIMRYILAENWLILLAGLFGGSAAALIALIPSFIGGNVPVAPGFLLLIITGILLNGMFWILLVAWLATRRSLVRALSDE